MPCMPSKRATIALFEIRENVRLAQEFAAGLSLDAFKADRRTFYAVTRVSDGCYFNSPYATLTIETCADDNLL